MRRRPRLSNDRLINIIEANASSGQAYAVALDDYGIASGEFANLLAKLHSLVDTDLVKLEKDMEARVLRELRGGCRSGERNSFGCGSTICTIWQHAGCCGGERKHPGPSLRSGGRPSSNVG